MAQALTPSTAMESIIVFTEILFGQGSDEQEIIPECHRLRKEIFHIEQVRGRFFVSFNSSQ
jgi:hypothetical protein